MHQPTGAIFPESMIDKALAGDAGAKSDVKKAVFTLQEALKKKHRPSDDNGLAGVELKKEDFAEMKEPPTEAQMKRVPPRVGKYDLCPCGSGKKFKWCCYTGDKQ